MEVDPDNWTEEMGEERVTYKFLEYAHDSTRELYEYHVKAAVWGSPNPLQFGLWSVVPNLC
jgi:hypothetical protein